MRVAVPGLPPVDLGITETTPTVGITDYSRRSTDDFGVTTVVKRGFARRLSLRFAVPFEAVDALQARLADLRATKAMWIADDRFRALSVAGIYKDFSIDVVSQPCSFCTLTIDGFAETLDYPDDGSDPAVSGASTFRLLQPVNVTDAVLRASSVEEDDAPAWAAGATYAKGARVVDDHRVYESLIDGNVGNAPPSSQWLDVEPTNRWAMFDQALGSATTAADGIVVILSSVGASALALLDVTGATVRVQGAGYDQERAVDGTMIFDGLPAGNIVVSIGGSGTVAVGTLLFGRIVGLGVTETSPTAAITDYSRKDTDDFGDVTIVERAWAKRMAARAMIRTDALDLVFERIAMVRATPSLWIGDEGTEALSVYGFFKDFSIEVGETTAKLSLQIEGLSRAAKLSPIGGGGGPVAWPDITDPNGTKPKDNADKTSENTSKDTNAVGGRPATGLLALIDEIDTVTIPAVNRAVADANVRIDAARQAADQAAVDANARIDAADQAIDDAVRDFAAEVERAQGADEALSRRIDSIVADGGGYDDRDIRAIVANEQLVRADDDRALAREIDIVSASVKDGDDAVRADVKVTTDALARSDEAFAQRAETIEASLGTVDSRIAAKAEEITTAYADADRALTRRIDSIVADGGYDDSAVRAEISRVDTTAIERDAAVARRVDTVEATFSPGGGNLVPNSDLVTTDGWSTGIHAPGGPLNAPPLFVLNAAGDPYHPVGENVLSMLQFGPPNGGDGSAYLEWASSTFPVTAGDYLQFSALVNCHRAPVTLFLAFRDATGGYLTAIPSPVVGPVENLGNRLSYYARAGVVSARVPDGAIGAYLILRKLDTIKDHTDSYAWFLRPYVGAAREGQTAWNPYSVGRASPVLLGTVARVKDTTDALARADAAFAERAQSIEASLGTVDARIGAKAEEVTRAYADADLAIASRATTLESAASAVSTSIVFNDNFNYWPDGQILPSRWSVWLAEGNFRTNRLAPGRGGGQYCVQTLNDVADVSSGFVQTIYTAGAGKWVIEVTAGFDTSGARGAGVTLHGVWNIDFCSDPDINGLIGDRPGETRSWTKMVDLDGRDQINVHAMHGWSGFGRGMAAKYMVWHRLALRPATDGEIKAGKAEAALNAPGGVLARITANEDALADLPNRYAAASRTATLEAQLRGEAASGLGNTIGAVNGRIDEASNVLSARIEDRATAIADAKAGAVAQTVQQLRSEYNGTAATVGQQAAAIAAADGRTSVYWEVVGTTGDGSTRVRLSKSDGQRGVFYVDADMIVDGNLLVNGSIITDKIANQAVTTPVAVTAGLTTASNGETKVAATAAFTASGIGFTRIDLQYDQRVNAQGTTGTARAFLRRTQNGVETTVSRAVGIQPQSSLGEPAGFLVVDYPAAGPVTYDLIISTDSGNRIFALLNIALIIAEIKK